MPKVKYRRANKDYPQFGIKKGEMHYHWTLMTGPRSSRQYRQKTLPKPSQLTASEFLREFYSIDEDLQELDDPNDLDDFIDRINQLRDETQDKFDNMPVGFQEGDTGQTMQERIDALDSWVSDLEGIDKPERESDEGEDEEADKEYQEALDEFKEAIKACTPQL